MFRNYLAIAFRNFRKHRLFSVINMAGLAIGISAALVIYLIVQHELNYDRFHANRDRIYRVVSTISFPDMVMNNSGVPVPTADATRAELTGIEDLTHFITAGNMKVAIPVAGADNPTIYKKQEDIIFADNRYFNFIHYKWLAGSPVTALQAPAAIVLTASRAHSYFGDTAPAQLIGRTIFYDDSIRATVTGVVEDLSGITDFTFREFLSRATIESNPGLKSRWSWESWGSINSASQMLVLLKPGVKSAAIEKSMAQLRERKREKNPLNKDNDKDVISNSLQPLADIHFNNKFDAFGQRQGHKPTLYGLLAVGGFLLLLGCINFVNLTTAQSSTRAKEIGIRKTMGSTIRQLMGQFLSETFLLTFAATLLSVAITPWLLHIFGNFIPPGVSFGSLNQPHVWLFLLLLIIIVTLFAGLYPAWVLTRFKPVTVLKNQAYSGTSQTRKAWLRKVLTVTQFVIAQFLLIAVLVVSKQIHYSLNKDLGYSKDAIVSVSVPWNFFSEKRDDRRFTLYNELKTLPGIEKISLAGSSPASTSTNSSTFTFKNGDRKIESMVELKRADTGYFSLYNMKLLAGRNLLQSDTTKEYIINETYAHVLGFKNPADAVGHSFGDDGKGYPIVGVVGDFHTKSLHEPIKPLAYSSAMNDCYQIHLALDKRQSPTDWKKTMATVETKFKAIFPDEDFEYNFFDEQIANFYKTEQDIARLLKWATALCIFISCLGLLGLVIYVTNARTKEIGVRKVLGASVLQLVRLISRDFLLLVLVAFIVVTPLAWWAMTNWLQDFAYRTSISWWIFAVTGVGMVLIAICILAARTIKAAMVNPVNSLRTE
ncbi:MAG: ABC transporter permease [Chitinophagaceae bacterium]